MRMLTYSFVLICLSSCASNPSSSTIENSAQKKLSNNLILNENALQTQLLINRRLDATIKAEQQMADAPPWSLSYFERRLFGNPYTKGRADLVEQSRQLAMVQENLRQQNQQMNEVRSMLTNSYPYGSNCFNVRPYYKRNGTHVRGHVRCR